MNGTLQYSLGLATGGFLGSLQAVQGRVAQFSGFMGKLPVIGASLAGLAGSVGSIHAIIEGAMGQIEKGATLNDLSKRTGESVGALYTLQKGFSTVGVAAESVAPALMTMQKALGGFSEMGEPTKNIFAGIGLSIDDLKAQEGPTALWGIIEALAKLRNDEAATAAFKIFGRSMGADMLQVARSADEFGTAMAGANVQAGMFQRNAAEFEAVDKGLAKLKTRFNGLFLGVAEGMAPALNGVLNVLNQIDLTGFGQKIGQAMGGAFEALREGQLGELLWLGLKSGFDAFSNYWAAGVVEMAAIFMREFAGVFQMLQAGFDNVVNNLASALGSMPGVGSMLGLSDLPMQTYSESLATRQELDGSGNQAADVMAATADSLRQMGDAAMTPFFDKLKFFADRLPRTAEGPGGTGRLLGAPPKSEKLKETKPEASNAWANIGFILGQGGAGGHQERIAQNTLRTANLLQKIIDRAPKPGAQQNFLQRATSPNTTFD